MSIVNPCFLCIDSFNQHNGLLNVITDVLCLC